MIPNRSVDYDTILYHVRLGDSLSKIISRYHGPVNVTQRTAIISQIKSDNPDVKNPDKIFPNQLLQLNVPPQSCSATTHPGKTPALQIDKKLVKPLHQQWKRSTPQEKNFLSTLMPVMLGTGSASMTMLNQTFTASSPLLTEMAKNYEKYKADSITKGQYDYRRKKIVSSIKSRLGPLRKLLNGKQTQSEVLRISKTRGRVPTQNIARQIGRMNRIAKHASRGGVVLSAVSLGLACTEIANTSNMHSKNEILVESLGGVIGGVVTGAAILLMITPVGWVAALAIGVGGAVGGYALGKGAKKLYSVLGNNIDISSAAGVTQLCR